MIDVKELPWDLLHTATVVNMWMIGDLLPVHALNLIVLELEEITGKPKEPVQTEFCLSTGQMIPEALA